MNQAARFDDQALWDTYGALLDADNRLKSHSPNPLCDPLPADLRPVPQAPAPTLDNKGENW